MKLVRPPLAVILGALLRQKMTHSDERRRELKNCSRTLHTIVEADRASTIYVAIFETSNVFVT